MPYPVERLLEVNEDVIEALLVLEVLLAQYPNVEDLQACLFHSDDLFRLRLQSAHKTFNITLLGWLMRLMVR